jgi:hypothetical protein
VWSSTFAPPVSVYDGVGETFTIIFFIVRISSTFVTLVNSQCGVNF